jgi:septal ring factor EnvC (AmiA/AmiB activator)
LKNKQLQAALFCMAAFLFGLCASRLCMGGDVQTPSQIEQVKQVNKMFAGLLANRLEINLLKQEITKTELKLKNDRARLKKLSAERQKWISRLEAILDGGCRWRCWGQGQ